ncbi:Hypothetical protein NTJ_06121 [Nesidiocoris tenuis]|uniref:Uncharacterized protein n=1 Tax=Nesidiocoris tenuis TaxID=355587 RepID=A0ABN7AM45_9HEMI|nr:Hypothetical protein NTJ_06121 [Nesidiocoris tenuis]
MVRGVAQTQQLTCGAASNLSDSAIYQGVSSKRARVAAVKNAASAAMPFIDDDLLWCPDGDNKMVDLSQCLDSGGGLGELTQTDLSGLVSGIDEDEDILKSFEVEQLLFDFNSDEREENNNSLLSGTNKNQTLAFLQELQRSQANRKLNIAAANPLLAEKLAAPGPLSASSTTSENGALDPFVRIKTEPGTRQGTYLLD